MTLMVRSAYPQIPGSGIAVKTHGYGVEDVVCIDGSEIPMSEFVAVVRYVLTNTDKRPNDPRTQLIADIAKMSLVPGWKTVFDPKIKSERWEFTPPWKTAPPLTGPTYRLQPVGLSPTNCPSCNGEREWASVNQTATCFHCGLTSSN